MKRARSGNNNNHLACNGTLQILYTGHSDFVVRQVGAPCDFEDGISTDSVDLVIHFRRPPPLPSGGGGTLMLQYVGAKHVESPLLWTQPLLPLDQGAPLTLRETELEYRCFPSYVAHVKNGAVSSVYLSVDNTGADSSSNFDLALQVHLNTRLQFMKEHLGDRGRFLDWFPPDVDPAQWGLRVDPRRIPQRTPLWFKLRGDVSGSKAYVLLGWFCNDNKVMSAFQKSAMRLGTHSEDAIVLMYCHTFPDRTFEEVGWCPAPGHPIGWGASPDGIVTDPSMTWDQVPDPAIRECYGDSCGITRGACEFKTSRTKLVVEPYFLAQVYMEMIALQVVWCDLVRYRPSREWDSEAGVWRYKDEAHVYRIFRYPAMEQRLVPLWKRAHANQHVLQKTIMHEAEYVAVRADLEQMARNQEPYRKITMTPQLEALLNAYQDYKKPLFVNHQEEEEEEEQEVWTRLTARHAELKRAKNGNTAAFVQLVAEQIKEYASLL